MTSKTKLLAAVLCLGAAGLAPAQQSKSQEELVKLRDEKLQKEFLKKADWTTDYDAAKARAMKEGKLIFAYFTRSYAK
ncbi:MAG TPA: hypothetical protein VEI02_09320 [Planctomycetota bacterium]|nr:hypothetical protein [Planctomycetota bacterium]